MSKTSIQKGPAHVAAVTAAPPAPALPRVGKAGPVRRAVTALASLRLTVVLFVLSMLLVFCGTMAQMDDGLWAVLSRMFRCWLAWIPLQTFVRFGQVFFWFPRSWELSPAWSFPFPGGWTIGGLLMVNLLAAHAVRFKISWKRSGILLIHSGLIILMLGEFFTGLFAVESHMRIPVNGSANYVERPDRCELAFVSSPDPKVEDVVAVPASLLRKGGVIRNEALPVDIEVNRYMVNTSLSGKVPDQNPATAGEGLEVAAVEQPVGKGVNPDQKFDMPAAYLTFKDKETGKGLGTYLMTPWLEELDMKQEVKVPGKGTFEVALRFGREYKPYTLHLKELRHDVYPGTDIAKNYSSRVQLVDPSRGENREVVIYMNHPLRYHGEAFYQSQTLQNNTMTGLAVVRNPFVWLMPYYSCAIVAVGMIVHFGIHLVQFLQRRAAL